VGRRLGAAAAGIALIAAAVLAFSLGKHPLVVGTNTASPLSPSVVIHGGETHCQLISRVPAGVSHVQLFADTIEGAPGDFRVKLRDRTGKIQFAGGRRLVLGSDVIRLKQPTTALHPARLCMHYFGRGHVVLAGERKRVPETIHTGQRRGVASILFLRPGLASWASQRDLIADRYANDQAGALGRWSLWLAIAAVIGAAALALFWLVFRLEPPRPVRRPPRPAPRPPAPEPHPSGPPSGAPLTPREPFDPHRPQQ
jgi:hypothetical protein